MLTVTTGGIRQLPSVLPTDEDISVMDSAMRGLDGCGIDDEWRQRCGWRYEAIDGSKDSDYIFGEVCETDLMTADACECEWTDAEELLVGEWHDEDRQMLLKWLQLKLKGKESKAYKDAVHRERDGRA